MWQDGVDDFPPQVFAEASDCENWRAAFDEKASVQVLEVISPPKAIFVLQLPIFVIIKNDR